MFLTVCPLLVLCLFLVATGSAAPLSKRYTQVRIVSGRSGLCLGYAPRSGYGGPALLQACDSAFGVLWDINPGSGSVILSGTETALDAGVSPGNNGRLKLWQSYPGLYQQTWYLTNDNRIAITGGDQCLDEGDGGVLQTYRCQPNNGNQVWYIRQGDDQPTPPPPPSCTCPT